MSPFDQFLRSTRNYYADGTSGHHPHVAESVTAALDATRHVAAEAELTVASLRAAVALLARQAAARATEFEAQAEFADRIGCPSVAAYLAAWSAATADELWRIERTIETELPGL